MQRPRGTRDDDPPPAHLRLLAQMRDALRAVAPQQVVHVPTPNAERPFDRYRSASAEHP